MSEYSPSLSEDELSALITAVKDWQLTHGSLLKLVRTEEENTVLARPIGVSVYPTLFPRTAFEEAQGRCSAFNELYATVAEEEDWLRDQLSDVSEIDDHSVDDDGLAVKRLVKSLLSIYDRVKQEGCAQEVVLGIFRSDYMLHVASSCSDVVLKQVEFNAYSCAGGVHANKVSDMHRHLQASGAYTSQALPIEHSNIDLPVNDTIHCLVQGLKTAHEIYSKQFIDQSATQRAILMVVQPDNINICDERPFEYALWHQEPPVPVYRVVFGSEVLARCRLDDSKRLVYSILGAARQVEVSVVYLRAGYDAKEYNEDGSACRYLLERSRAIKCPSILSHLTTLKTIQQALSNQGALERFVKDPATVAALRQTFMPMHQLHKNYLSRLSKSQLEQYVHSDYILKPSLEGGGHNVFGADICDWVSEVPESYWPQYILQQRIRSPTTRNILMSPLDLYDGPTVSELGIFGTCIWRRRCNRVDGEPTCEILYNAEAGWSLKTKQADQNEMSVVKGFGCFTSLMLVDHATWARHSLAAAGFG